MKYNIHPCVVSYITAQGHERFESEELGIVPFNSSVYKGLRSRSRFTRLIEKNLLLVNAQLEGMAKRYVNLIQWAASNNPHFSPVPQLTTAEHIEESIKAGKVIQQQAKKLYDAYGNTVRNIDSIVETAQNLSENAYQYQTTTRAT